MIMHHSFKIFFEFGIRFVKSNLDSLLEGGVFHLDFVLKISHLLWHCTFCGLEFFPHKLISVTVVVFDLADAMTNKIKCSFDLIIPILFISISIASNILNLIKICFILIFYIVYLVVYVLFKSTNYLFKPGKFSFYCAVCLGNVFNNYLLDFRQFYFLLVQAGFNSLLSCKNSFLNIIYHFLKFFVLLL